jgi:hypothetical protein
MIPTVISWSILLAGFTSRIVGFPSFKQFIYSKFILFRFLIKSQKEIFLLLLATIIVVYPIRYANSLPKETIPGLNDNKYGYKDLPIVVQFSHNFLKRLHYSPERNRYFFILDWQAAVDNSSGLFTTQEYKHMEALKRNYPELFKHVIKSEDFLNRYTRFLVLDDLDYEKKCTLDPQWDNISCPKWLEMRIISNPKYKLTVIGQVEDRKLLLVKKQ